MLIFPFRGILYDIKNIKGPKNLFSPPYDIISPSEQDAYYRASPYNVVRLELNKATKYDNEQDNVYTRAAKFFNGWLKDGILEQDKEPAIYVYGQSFLHNKKMRHTLGFIAAAKIEQSRHSQVRPHEMTFKAPKQDREKILEVVRANLSCIYTLVEDKGLKINALLRQASKDKPFVDVEIDRVWHRIWKLSDRLQIERLQRLMASKKAFIADGHHRYEAAANFRDRMQKIDKNYSDRSPYNYVMMYFTSMEDKNLTILATHRVVKDNSPAGAEFFQVIPAPNKKKMFEELGRHFGRSHVFGLYSGGIFAVLKLKDKKSKEKLDVAILHSLVLNDKNQNIYYTRDANEAIKLVDSAKYRAAFFLNPTPASQIRDTSLAGEKMPHKSTYFYPKLLTGLVMRSLAAA